MVIGKPKPVQVIGQYKLMKCLGTSNMSEVWYAIDDKVEREVALKFLAKDLLESPEAQSRFKQEIQILAKLEHPHIVWLDTYHEHEGRIFLVMKYMGGGNLIDKFANLTPKRGRVYLILKSISKYIGESVNFADKLFPLADEKTFSIAETIAILKGIAFALDYVHSQQIVHLDIKPSNILFNEAGQAVLGDFGIGRLLNNSLERTIPFTTQKEVVGTWLYMSPEQRSGQEVNHLSDIYSLGIVAFEMLTGRTLLEFSSRFDLPYALDEAFKKVLNIKPQNRYSSASDFIRALETAQTYEEIKTFLGFVLIGVGFTSISFFVMLVILTFFVFLSNLLQ